MCASNGLRVRFVVDERSRFDSHKAKMKIVWKRAPAVLGACDLGRVGSGCKVSRGVRMDSPDRITADPKVLGGKPVIRGTRISVELVLELLDAGWTHDQILASYPHLVEDDLAAVLAYSRVSGQNRKE